MYQKATPECEVAVQSCMAYIGCFCQVACHLARKPNLNYIYTKRLGVLRAPTSSWRHFGPLDFVLRALRALRPCNPRKVDLTNTSMFMMHEL